MRTQRVPGLFGDLVTQVIPDDDEIAEFRTELWKAGFTDPQRDEAADVLFMFLPQWTPREAAEMLAVVVHSTGSDNMIGCAMAAKHVAGRWSR